MTSTTTPTGASRASAGGNATSTRTRLRYLDPVALLLSPPGPRDRALVLGMRTAHLLRVHDPGPGRHPLPGALGQAAGHAARDPDRPPRDLRGRWRGRDEDADRDQRR